MIRLIEAIQTIERESASPGEERGDGIGERLAAALRRVDKDQG
jgi:hypothetical protein